MKKQDEWCNDIQKLYRAAKEEKAQTDLAVLADTLLKGVTTAIKDVSFVHGTGGGGGGGCGPGKVPWPSTGYPGYHHFAWRVSNQGYPGYPSTRSGIPPLLP
eukprot:118463-Rhodomonas_salina.2